MKHTIILLLTSLVLSSTARAQISGWNSILSIQFQENSGTNLINYQMEINLNTADLVTNNGMLPSGADIRFTNGCTGGTFYPYWIESGMNTTSTKIWVKIDTLLSNSSKTIYMHFNNASASTVSSINGTFIGPHSSTDSVVVGTAGGVVNSQRGFRFAPNENILVTSFGKNEPQGSTRFVTLFDFTTQSILAQTQVSGPASVYSYSNINSPIWLTTGTQYVLELYQGPSDGYFYGSSSQIGQHLTYLDMRYCNGCTENTFPTNFLTNYHYGFPDVWYYTKNTATVTPTYTTSFNVSTIDAGSDQTICVGDSITLNGSGATSYSWDNGITNGVAFTPTNSQTYTVMGTNAAGCAGMDQVVITLNELPTVDAGINQAICLGSSITLSGTGALTYLWDNSITDGTPFTPANTATYNLTGTDVNGCENTDQLTVTVNALPTIDAGLDQIICADQTITLTANGAINYNWDNSVQNGIAFSPTASAIYTVIGTDANGCENTDQLTVTVNNIPVVNAGADQIICSGDTITLVGSGATSYSWNNSVTDGIPFIPASSAIYNLIGTDANGCEDSDELMVTILDHSTSTQTASGLNSYTWPENGQTYTQSGSYTTILPNAAGCDSTITLNLTLNFSAIDENTTNFFQAYPNPTNALLNIDGEWIENKAYELIDISGRILLTGTFKSTKEILDLGNLSCGQYRLRLEGKEIKVLKD